MDLPDPTTVLDDTDPGDDTQLRFRYQHGYGVILLCAAATKKLSYVAIWCEHHEDMLGEKVNGQFDSFQIKTRTPEHGPWKMSDDEFRKSIGRFVDLDQRFPGRFDEHSFVSNVRCYAGSKPGRSPTKFLRAVKTCTACDDLDEVNTKSLEDLAMKLARDKNSVFDTCKRTKVSRGPSLDDFETSIAHQHLPQLDGCASLSPTDLNGLRDELMHVVFRASSIAIDDPSLHWCCVLGSDAINPKLRAKRLISVETVHDALAERALVFRFAPTSSPLRLGAGKQDVEILSKKLLKGGIANQLESMQSRTLSSEQHLLALVAQDPDEAGRVINQLKEVVQGICSDAQAIASGNPEPWGMDMYRHVVTRLQDIADHKPNLVHNQIHECLMGIAGLLTEECKVWWSPRFDPSDAL